MLRVYARQEQITYKGHCESTCYHPSLLFNREGDCLAVKLRLGNVHSAEGWKGLLLPEIEHQVKVGKEVAFWAYAAFAKTKIYEALDERGVKYTNRIPADDNLRRDIEEVLKRPLSMPGKKPLVQYKGFLYEAGGWKTGRRVAVKEVSEESVKTDLASGLGKRRGSKIDLIGDTLEVRPGLSLHVWQAGGTLSVGREVIMEIRVDRRKFVGLAAASGVFSIVPRHVLGGRGYVAPSDKITLAHIGMGTQAFNELGSLLADPGIQIVAVCDPNTDSGDYIEWSKGSIRNKIRAYLGNPSWRENDNGCPGGREVGREVVDTYYGNQRGGETSKSCAAYADFRELLEKEKDLDAVKIMTPDHLHATVSIAAMRKGKHVLMHKPLANRMYEARLVIETARVTKVATHLLAYGSGTANGTIAARVKEGAIGTLREIHNWTNRPVWPQYTEIPVDAPRIPKGFDWGLWLGPALDRPYHPCYTHTVFRGWYDFGGGSMADMGIYSLWPVFTALNLSPPVSAEAWATHTCRIEDQVSRLTQNDSSYPTACTLRFHFAAQADLAAVDLFWYDGGMRPRMPAEIEAQNIEVPFEGILFVGDKGMIVAGFNGQNPQLLTQGKCELLWPPQLSEEGSRQGPTDPAERNKPWLEALKGGAQSPGSFLKAGPISDTVNLGTVALRAKKKVMFDGDSMRITNDIDANKYLFREYRKGWEL